MIGFNRSFIFNCTEPHFYNKKLEMVKIKNHPINDQIERISKAEYYKNIFIDYDINNKTFDCKIGDNYTGNNDNVWFFTHDESKILIDLENENMFSTNNMISFSAKNMKNSLVMEDSIKAFILNSMYKLRRHPFFIKQSLAISVVDLNMHLKDKYKGFSAEVKEHLMKLENAIFANITGNFTIPKNRLKNFEDFSGTKFSINIDTSISPLEKQKLKEYYFGDQLNYIVFDCQNPSVILYNKTKINGLFKEAVVLNSNQLKVQNYECINDVWQSKGNFLLYDKERLTFDELQMEKLALTNNFN